MLTSVFVKCESDCDVINEYCIVYRTLLKLIVLNCDCNSQVYCTCHANKFCNQERRQGMPAKVEGREQNGRHSVVLKGSRVSTWFVNEI